MTSKASGVKIGKSLTAIYTPAATIVAACIKAETGVGPSIASGSHICSGNCDDLPTAPINIPRPAKVRVSPVIASPLAIESNIGPNAKEPTAEYNSIMPMKNPMSPTLFVKNAFLLASAALSFSNQCPMSKYELTPTSSQDIYMEIRLSARTIPFIEKVNSPRYAKYLL